MDTHYVDMKGKPCPVCGGLTCETGECRVCEWRLKQGIILKERARELVKEIDSLEEK